MKFGYQTMFPKIAESKAIEPPNLKDIDQLALMMTNSDSFKEGAPDFAESFGMLKSFGTAESGPRLPSGYVYLSQFIAHDLSFDSMSDRHTPTHQPWNEIDITKVFNKRNPLLDLETIYGSDFVSNPKEPPRSALLAAGSKSKLSLGPTFPYRLDPTTAALELLNDLPREGSSPRANIVDQRNDENLLVAQTQVAFIKFHNAIVDELGRGDTTETFERARKIAIKHYLAIIRKDFLPRIVDQNVLTEIEDQVNQGTNKFYIPTDDDRYLPLEFVAAAFRFGHSLIRNEYRYNIKHDETDMAKMFHLFEFTGRGKKIDASTKYRLRTSWVINWRRFYDFSLPNEPVDPYLNFAEPFDTRMSSSLNLLLPMAMGGNGRVNSLSALDLYRGVALKLPTGQEVADVLCQNEKLDSTEIELTFGPTLSDAAKSRLSGETPLFYYILAEAERRTGGLRLGPVGSRIVAEVMLRLIKDTERIILDNDNELDFYGNENGEFGMTDLLSFIDKHRDPANLGVDEINPIQEISLT